MLYRLVHAVSKAFFSTFDSDTNIQVGAKIRNRSFIGKLTILCLAFERKILKMLADTKLGDCLFLALPSDWQHTDKALEQSFYENCISLDTLAVRSNNNFS